jgi:hypothetical protein
VSAVPADEEPVAGPSNALAGPSGDAGGHSRGGRGGGHRRESWRVRPNFSSNSSDEEDLQVDDDSEESEDSEECEDSDESRDGKLSEDSIDSEDREEGENKMENAKHVEMEAEPEMFEVGDFVAAVYEGQWLLAQVDIDQDQAGNTHVNLAYMERVGKNQFKWPKQDDRLLTLREDILFKCSAPVLVGSSIRACHVGLPGKQAAEADAALDLVVYLQKSLFLSLNQIFFWPHPQDIWTQLAVLIKIQKFDFYLRFTAKQ